MGDIDYWEDWDDLTKARSVIHCHSNMIPTSDPLHDPLP